MVTADASGDGEWLPDLVQATANALPVPTPKKVAKKELGVLRSPC